MAKPSPKNSVVIRFHKPAGVITLVDVPDGRPGIRDFVDLPPETYPIGRLDMDSEGLLLLTNDPPLMTRLLHPQYGHERTYWVQVAGEPDEEDIERLRNGTLNILGAPARPAFARILHRDPDFPPKDPPFKMPEDGITTWVEITLTEGRNRQVRRMTAAVGHPTLRLVRVAIGPLRLGQMKSGDWEYLNLKEREQLFATVGLEDEYDYES